VRVGKVIVRKAEPNVQTKSSAGEPSRLRLRASRRHHRSARSRRGCRSPSSCLHQPRRSSPAPAHWSGTSRERLQRAVGVGAARWLPWLPPRRTGSIRRHTGAMSVSLAAISRIAVSSRCARSCRRLAGAAAHRCGRRRSGSVHALRLLADVTLRHGLALSPAMRVMRAPSSALRGRSDGAEDARGLAPLPDSESAVIVPPPLHYG